MALQRRSRANRCCAAQTAGDGRLVRLDVRVAEPRQRRAVPAGPMARRSVTPGRAQDVVELHVHLRQRLLHVLHAAAAVACRTGYVPAPAGRSSSTGGSTGSPAVLRPRPPLHLEARPVENLEHRATPVDSSTPHDNSHAAIASRAAERPNRALGHRRRAPYLPHVDPRAVRGASLSDAACLPSSLLHSVAPGGTAAGDSLLHTRHAPMHGPDHACGRGAEHANGRSASHRARPYNRLAASVVHYHVPCATARCAPPRIACGVPLWNRARARHGRRQASPLRVPCRISRERILFHGRRRPPDAAAPLRCAPADVRRTAPRRPRPLPPGATGA